MHERKPKLANGRNWGRPFAVLVVHDMAYSTVHGEVHRTVSHDGCHAVVRGTEHGTVHDIAYATQKEASSEEKRSPVISGYAMVVCCRRTRKKKGMLQG